MKYLSSQKLGLRLGNTCDWLEMSSTTVRLDNKPTSLLRLWNDYFVVKTGCLPVYVSVGQKLKPTETKPF